MRAFFARAFLALLIAFAPVAAPAQMLLRGVGNLEVAAPPTGATFVGLTVHQVTTGSEAFTASCGAGCAPGDLVVAYVLNNGGGVTLTLAGSSTALTVLASNNDVSAFTNIAYANVLGSADAAAPSIQIGGPAVTDYMVVIAIYRGATTATVKDFQNQGSGPTVLSYAGFVPDVATKGTLIFTDNLSAGNITSLSNGTWTFRANPTTITSGFFNFYLADQLSGYVNASSQQSNLGGGNTKTGYEIEIK